jgi:hypothetical protein
MPHVEVSSLFELNGLFARTREYSDARGRDCWRQGLIFSKIETGLDFQAILFAMVLDLLGVSTKSRG